MHPARWDKDANPTFVQVAPKTVAIDPQHRAETAHRRRGREADEVQRRLQRISICLPVMSISDVGSSAGEQGGEVLYSGPPADLATFSHPAKTVRCCPGNRAHEQ